MLTHGSFFTGGGVAQAMLEPEWSVVFGVECDPSNYNQSMRIADCYERNIGGHMIRKPVQELIMSELPYVDWFHASPVCKNFSNAKAGASESDIDIVTAKATLNYITHHKPRFVTIENVWGYRKSEAWAMLGNGLLQLGYGMRVDHVNMANYGVPQTRKRMIVQAVLSHPRLSALPTTHAKKPKQGGFFFDTPLKKWVGWYEAIEDLIPTLKPDRLADWQLKRLPDEIKGMYLLGCGNYSNPKPSDAPSDTITSNSNQLGIRAYLVNTDSKMGIAENQQPAFTVVSSRSSDVMAYLIEARPEGDRDLIAWDKQTPCGTVKTASEGNVFRALSQNGRVVRMSDRCLARFQSIPDSYDLPEKTSDAVTLIGNGVPSLFMKLVGNRFAQL